MAGASHRLKSALILSGCLGLAGCQSTFSEPVPEPVAVGLLPLTVEQVLPANVSASAVYERDGCYYYRTPDRFVAIATVAAPDARQPYCDT